MEHILRTLVGGYQYLAYLSLVNTLVSTRL